eukprot:jgi/Tetstr1/439044/TSEL_027536.t1
MSGGYLRSSLSAVASGAPPPPARASSRRRSSLRAVRRPDSPAPARPPAAAALSSGPGLTKRAAAFLFAWRPVPRRAAVATAAASADGETGDGLAATCADLSRSFLQACIPELGVSYTTALANFVFSSLTAHRAGASPAAVALQWQMTPGTGDAQLDSALQQRGGLAAEEAELRASWLHVCFLAFREAGEPGGGDLGLDEPRLGLFVRNVVELARQGCDPGRVKLAEVFAMSPSEAPPRSELESAALSQAVRLVFLALAAIGATTRDGAPIVPDSVGASGGLPMDTPPPADGSKGRLRGEEGTGKADDAARGARFRAQQAAEAAEAAKEAGEAPARPGYGGESETAAAAQPQQQEQEQEAGAEEEVDEGAIRAGLQKLRARELKERLTAMDVDASSCFDKEGLVERLTAALLQ